MRDALKWFAVYWTGRALEELQLRYSIHLFCTRSRVKAYLRTVFTSVLLLLLLAGCVKYSDGTVIDYEKNTKPNWICRSETIAVIRFDDGQIGHRCGSHGKIGDRVRFAS